MEWLWVLIVLGVLARIVWKLMGYFRILNLMKEFPGFSMNMVYDIKKIGMDHTELRKESFRLATGVASIFDKQRMCKIVIGVKPMVVFFKPEEVETILTSHASMDKSDDYKYLHPWLGRGLVTSEGLQWKKSRKILTPAFHFSILEEFFPVMNEQGLILIDKMKEASIRDEWVDIVYMMGNCTLDVICETAMGIKIKAQDGKHAEYVKALQIVQEAFSIRTTIPWYKPDWIFYLLPVGRRYKKCLKTLHDFSAKVIRERKSEFCRVTGAMTDCKKDGTTKSTVPPTNERLLTDKKQLAFLDLLLHYHVHDKMLTEGEIQEQVDTFMFAGHDTTAITISWALYLLGLHKNIQAKVHEEQMSIFGEDKSCLVNEEDVKKMKYLECVIKETQRLYPTIPLIGRRLRKDLTINGYVIPEGLQCLILINKLHRDKEVFPNPEVFQPERFFSENSKGRHPFAFIPFSGGPRNCIGQRFAMNEARVLLSLILRNFTVHSLDQRDKITPTMDLVLKPTNPLRLKLVPR